MRRIIDSVPAVIATQGTWCLRRDLSTAITDGNAISIATNNVTIDCNDFKLGGLAAGPQSGAVGILAEDRQNTTVRGCSIRGFETGILLNGGAGHLVEDNRLDNNLHIGILAIGDNVTVRHNRVYDTGGTQSHSTNYGIAAFADIHHNTVSGVFSNFASALIIGIWAGGDGPEVRGNRIRGLVPAGEGSVSGIYVLTSAARIIDNQVTSTLAIDGIGVNGIGTRTTCTGNSVTMYEEPYVSCEVSSGNTSQLP